MGNLYDGALEPGVCFILYDWMQTTSLPQAHCETSEMFHEGAQKELAVFGGVLHQRTLAGVLHKHQIVIVTDVRDHTCAGAVALLEQVKPFMLEQDKVRAVWMFSDCGPHFRALEFVGGV